MYECLYIFHAKTSVRIKTKFGPFFFSLLAELSHKIGFIPIFTAGGPGSS